MRKVPSKTSFGPLVVIMAGLATSLAMWPALAARTAPAASATPAPLIRDYQTRDQTIAFYERQMRAYPSDQIQMRMLAQLYLQRYRERFDPGDIARAQRLALRSIALQPQGNTSAQMTLASAQLSFHDFRNALGHEQEAWRGDPSVSVAGAQVASLEMELGSYERARNVLSRLQTRRKNPSVEAVQARYDEITGRLQAARSLIDDAARIADSDVSNPAYDRSWFHLRAGQLAFEAGDFARADTEYRTALDDFPDNAVALMWQARLYRAQRRWGDALVAARRSADLYPLPQTLGYKADAQRALGDRAGAAQTDALIDAEQRLYNVNGVNDRLLANYYAERRTHLDAALRAAKSDLAKRGDEIYADDTMAWVLAAMGRWSEADVYARRALRTGSVDPELQYHAGAIALHCGRRNEGRAMIEAALRENPSFDPYEADDARALLAGSA